MHLEYVFNGSPYDFGREVKTQCLQWRLGNGLVVWVLTTFQPDVSVLGAYFWLEKRGPHGGPWYSVPHGEIEAMAWVLGSVERQQPAARAAVERRPGGKSWVAVDVMDARWPEVQPWWNEVTGGLARQGWMTLRSQQERRAPTRKVRDRAAVFKRLKDRHPEWGYDTVAMKATDELQEHITVDTVRYVYAQMGWTWERADRVR